MLTLISLGLGICFIKSIKKKILVEIKMLLFICFAIVVFADGFFVFGLYTRINDASTLLSEESERLPIAEQELDSLISSFRYVPEYGDDTEYLFEFVDECYNLNKEIEFLKQDIVHNQKRLNLNSNMIKLCEFMIDFGIFSGKILESMK